MTDESSGHKPSDQTAPIRPFGAQGPPEGLDYELVRLIGRGGYGNVWLVRDRSGQFFACKVVYRESFNEDRPYEREFDGIRRFEPVSRASESQVKILHVGRRDDAGYFYYIMELADDVDTGPGLIQPETYIPKTLRSEIVRRKKLPAEECIRLGLSLCAALENLHQHGLIHRDIKPANIIFVKGLPKLADIGLVTDMDVNVSYVGTEGFIPPEGPKSAQADIYALGKVLYEIATGKDRLEFPELPPDFSELPDWPALLELNAIIVKACEINPSKRYASAIQMHDDLALLITGKSVRKIQAMKRRLHLAFLALLVVGVTWGGIRLWEHQMAAVPGLPMQTTKLPMPLGAEVAQKENELRQTYHVEMADGTSESRSQRAVELLKRSETAENPVVELASLRVAGVLAATADDVSLIMAVCNRIDRRFAINILAYKAELLAQAGGHARTPQNRRDLADICLVTGFEAIAAEDYTSAAKLAGIARNFAQDSNVPHLLQEADFLGEQVARCERACTNVGEFWKTLRRNPMDSEACLTVGKFLCFTKNDWATGLTLLVRCNDQALRSVAKTEISGTVSGPQEQIALGNSWWDLSADAPADDKIFYQQRARYWYLKAIASSNEPDKAQLKRQLSERINAVPLEAAEIHIVSRVGGEEFVDIYSDEVQWKSSRRGTTGNRINHVNLGDFNADGLAIIKNTEATWLMPAAVDFSTAQLVVDHRQNRRGQASLQIEDDHVRVTLAHPRLGASEIAVTVRFSKRP